jgi:hypothetical protein
LDDSVPAMTLHWPSHALFAFLLTALFALGLTAVAEGLLLWRLADPGPLAFLPLVLLLAILFAGAAKTKNARRRR